jgi:hypothetical protein
MKTYFQYSLKRIIICILISNICSSCIYYEDAYPTHGTNGRDGRAYVKLNWYDKEPDYIETNGLVPTNFYWNSYYQSMPGYYIVHYEFDYNNGLKIVTYAYEADVEVWVNRGETGGMNYNGRNGNDSYFDLALYADGGYDFKQNTSLKNSVDNAIPQVKPMGIIDSVTNTNNGISIKIIYKRVEPRTKRIM